MAPVESIRVGDAVRIRGTPATLAADLAGLSGEVRAVATLPVVGASVIGSLKEGCVYQVQFEPDGASFWLTPEILEVTTHAGMTETPVGLTEAPAASSDGKEPPNQGKLSGFLVRIRKIFRRAIGVGSLFVA